MNHPGTLNKTHAKGLFQTAMWRYADYYFLDGESGYWELLAYSFENGFDIHNPLHNTRYKTRREAIEAIDEYLASL